VESTEAASKGNLGPIHSQPELPNTYNTDLFLDNRVYNVVDWKRRTLFFSKPTRICNAKHAEVILNINLHPPSSMVASLGLLT